MRRFEILVLALAVLGAADGCGAGPRPIARRGQEVFARSCAACHTLAGRDSGTGSGDLADIHLSVADVTSFAKIMPVRPRLSAFEALAVAQYIHSVSTSSARKRG